MKNLSSLFIILVASFLVAHSQQAALQFVHCSADSALNKVDIWLDTTKVLDDFSFRSSSSPIPIDTGISIEIRVCPSNSNDTSNCLVLESFNVSSEQHFQAFVSGFVTSGYDPFVDARVSIHEIKTTPSLENHSEFSFYNSASDIGSIDILDITTNISQLTGDLSFGQFSNYTELEAFNYVLRFRNGSNLNVIREIEFFLGDQQLSDSAFTVVITGFENRSSNFNGPALGFHIVRNYGGAFIPLDIALSQIQIINNVPEKALNSLDLYINENLSADNLKFRYATGYINVASGRKMLLSASLNTSTSSVDSIVSIDSQLEYGNVYTYILSGLNDLGISPYKPLTFTEFESKKIASTGYNCDIAWVHGSSDIDEISVNEKSQLGETLFSQNFFGDFSDYISIPAANYQIEVHNELTDTTILEYSVPLSQLGGSAQTWVLSGFLDTNSSDSSNRIGVYIATQSGGEMKELNTSTGIQTTKEKRFSLFPNPSNGLVQFQNVSESIDYKIYGLDGKLWMQGSTNSNHLLDLEPLPSGIYSILIETGDYFQSERLILSK